MLLTRIDRAWYVKPTLRATFPPSVPPERRLVTNRYTAYFDESGTHPGSEYVVVAGFVANEPAWLEFSAEWQVALDSYDLEFFHMSDFENRQGPYRFWCEDERKERLNQLLDIIHKHVFQSIGCIVLKKSFDSIMSPQARIICGDAYGLASLACFRNLGDTAKNPKIDGVMDYIMERGAMGSTALLHIWREGAKDPKWMENNRIHSLDFRDKRAFLPLQAADILAYELYKHASRRFGQESRPTRYPIKRLARTLPQWNYIDNEELGRTNDWLSAPT